MENKYCTNCGTELSEGNTFCGSCGNKLVSDETPQYCVGCGSSLEGETNFCTVCGIKVTDSSSSYRTARQSNKNVEPKNPSSFPGIYDLPENPSSFPGISEPNENQKSGSKKKKLIIGIAVLVSIIVLVNVIDGITSESGETDHKEAQASLPKATGEIDQRVEKKPEIWSEKLIEGVALTSQGKYDEAISIFKEIPELTNDGIALQSAYFWLGEVYSQYKIAEREVAIKYYSEAIALGDAEKLSNNESYLGRGKTQENLAHSIWKTDPEKAKLLLNNAYDDYSAAIAEHGSTENYLARSNWWLFASDLFPTDFGPRTEAEAKSLADYEKSEEQNPLSKSEASNNASNTSTSPSLNPIDSKIELVIVEVPSNLPQYDRDDWKHWIDEDGDCQNIRHEVLIAESLTDVNFKDNANCLVANGEWLDPFTATKVTDATKLDVDHMVPLKNAHESGGWTWNQQKKMDYANHIQYEDHLIAVTASANRQKGARGPDEWKPSNEEYWCDYAQDWIAIKVEWNLTATNSEWAALQDMLDSCAQSISIVPVLSEKADISTRVVQPSEANSTYSNELKIVSLDCKGKPEIVLIRNDGDYSQDMTGWSIHDEGIKHTFRFPKGLIVDSGKSIQVVSGGTGLADDSSVFWKKQPVWNNDGDTASMLNSDGSIVMTKDCS
tara:strand:+ start:183 stop:2183 length:2001 start_codon:yes stop_codon:yes gene_type:complete